MLHVKPSEPLNPADIHIAPKMDWAQVMVDLHNNGCTAYRVHLTLGVSDTTARNWMKGGEPGYGYGRALLRLHSAYCGAGLTTLRVHEAEERAYIA
jgi:hypothetical protein